MLRILFLFLIIGSSLVKLQAQDVSYSPPSMKYARFTTLQDFLFRYAYYPAHFIDEGAEANIDITLRICKDGSICLLDLKGHNADLFKDHLTREVVKTDKHWAPAMLNGVPIDTLVRQKVLYTLYGTQNYLNDSTVVEKGAKMAFRKVVKGDEDGQLFSFFQYDPMFTTSAAFANSNEAYYNASGDRVGFEEFLLLRRPGYDAFLLGEKFMADSNYIEAIKHYMLSERENFYPVNLFLNRATAFFMLDKPVLGCRDLIRIKGFDKKIDKVIEENCIVEKIVEKPLEKGTF